MISKRWNLLTLLVVLPVCTFFNTLLVIADESDNEKNVLINGKLNSDQGTFPDGWQTKTPEKFRYSRTEGHGGTGMLEVTGNGEKIEKTIRQSGLKLTAGEPYKISGWVKTHNFSNGDAGIVAFNNGWTQSVGIKKLPVNTGNQWKYFETVASMVPSTGTHSFGCCTVNIKGTIAFSDLALIPLSERARNESSNAVEAGIKRIPFALSPRLYRIPEDMRRIVFAFPYLSGKRPVCRATVNGKTVEAEVGTDGRFTLELPALAQGAYRMELMMTEKNGKEISRSIHLIRILSAAVVEKRGYGKRLNSQVIELVQHDFKTPATGTLRFFNPRKGWIYISGNGSLELNGEKLPAGESMRELPEGSHTLKYAGIAGRLVVRAVPILGSNGCCDPKYSGYVADPLTSIEMFYRWNVGNLLYTGPQATITPLEKWYEWKRHRVGNVGITFLDANPDAEKLVSVLKKSTPITSPLFNGISLDEFSFANRIPMLQAYAEAMREYGVAVPKDFYTCTIAKPYMPAHGEFISAALNAGQGNGKLLVELYCMQQPTLLQTEQYLNNMLDLSTYEKSFPGSLKSTVIMLGVIGYPKFMMEHYPEIDNKYFLDLQMFKIANSKTLEDIGGIGLWGTHNTGEETMRWSYRLMRHYFIEGNRDMLSDHYGYTFKPGHISNCDFENGLDHWKTFPAASESIRPVRVNGFGRNVRWASDGSVGNTFCMMRKNAEKENLITQIAHGLKPGQLYSFKFIVADYENMLKNNNEIKHFDHRLVVLPEEAEILPELTSVFVHSDAGSRSKANYARVNIKRYVFRAKKAEVTVGISDWKSKIEPGSDVGRASAFNFVSLTPYFEEVKSTDSGR